MLPISLIDAQDKNTLDVIPDPLLVAVTDEEPIDDVHLCAEAESRPSNATVEYVTSIHYNDISESDPPGTNEITNSYTEVGVQTINVSVETMEAGIQAKPVETISRHTTTDKSESSSEEQCLTQMMENIESALLEYVTENDKTVNHHNEQLGELFTSLDVVKKAQEEQKHTIKLLHTEKEDKKDRKIKELMRENEQLLATVHDQKLKLGLMQNDL